jgi:hypothetical protein
MLHVWLVAAISVVALHFQHKFGVLGKSRETFLVALAYTILCNQIIEFKMTFVIALQIDVVLWYIFVISIFKRRFETLDEDN